MTPEARGEKLSKRFASAFRGKDIRFVLATMLFVFGLVASGVMLPASENLAEPSRAYADTMPAALKNRPSSDNETTPPAGDISTGAGSSNLRVQAVLSSKRRAVLASAMDGIITKFNVDNGDLFEKGDVLAEYDCSADRARLREVVARKRATQIQVDAYKKLKDLESASDIEYQMAVQSNEQNSAQVDQINSRLKLCKIIAPFEGRVTNKMASAFEFVQTGRVMMDISSREPLRAEFLIPSTWLRWLNMGTPVRIYINESGRDYQAEIVAVHGEVDPVSQSVQVVAEMEEYHEELLPGMSGYAVFKPETAKVGLSNGFLGLVLKVDWKGDHEPK